MTTAQALIREWALFAGATALLAAAALAVALLVARRGARRLSSHSRYMLVAIALIVPLAAALLVPVAAGGWDRLLALRERTALPAPSVIETDIDLAGAAAAAPQVDALLLVALLWGAVFLLIAAARFAEWVRWTRVARRGSLCDDGRVLVAFNRAWRGKAPPPTVRISASCEEPMVVGLVDPVVLLPVGYGDAMTDTEIESVAVHELEHVMRRDNLDAAIVDLVASIFWFDPFHWIARGRLLELREGACDERVLASGLPPRAYLSALAKTSHAAITTPAVACMSGFRVRERMESIMSYPTHKSHWISEGTVRTFALALLGVLALAIAGFAPLAADEPALPGQHRLAITMTPAQDGRILIDAEVRTPEGALVSAPRIMAQAGVPVEASTSTGGKQYKLSITPAADGSGFAKLVVLEDDDVVDTVVKSIEAPKMRMRKQAEPIDLHLSDADIHDVARMVTKLTGVQIKVADSVQGKVSIDADDMPWDEALANAIAPLGLRAEWRQEGLSIVSAADPGERSQALKRLPPPPPGYVRVVGDVKAPTVITRVNPIYPEAARKDRVQGIVIAEVLIGEDGLVRDVKILKGLPLGLDQAALDAVRQWTFEPATQDGKPVAVAFNLTVNFKLDGKKPSEP